MSDRYRTEHRRHLGDILIIDTATGQPHDAYPEVDRERAIAVCATLNRAARTEQADAGVVQS